MNYRRIGRWAAGVGAVAVAGAGLYWLRERRTERPDHVTVAADGAFELRRYPPMLMAWTVQPGARDRALGRGFGVLAAYLFGEGREGGEIAMTVPVIAQALEGRGWRIGFVMPKAHTRHSLPAPEAGTEIAITPARRVATVRFAGRADDALLAERTAALADWVRAQGLEPAGAAEQAYYNSPFVPGPVRHNEIWQPVV